MNYQLVSKRLKDGGILLLSDKALPSVVSMVGGPEVKGSWWGHEKGHDIWRILKRLDADPDVLVTRLVSGKVTYIHRRLWADFLTVAISREPWQTRGLSPAARRLLVDVTKAGEIRMDRYSVGKDPKRLREAARQLERRLLAYSDEIHTEKGSHAKILATWSLSPKLRGERLQLGGALAAKKVLEKTVLALELEHGAEVELPWQKVI